MKNQYDGMFSRAVPVASIDDEGRTVQNVITTEDPAIVFDWVRWEPIREVLLTSGMVAPKQVPLLNAHSRFSTSDILGSVRNMRVEGDQVLAETTFSSTAEREWTLLKEGHLTDTSIGYKIDDAETVTVKPGEKAMIEGREYRNEYGDEMPLVIRKKWYLKENSLVPIGADQRAKFRSEFVHKEEQEHPARHSARWMQNYFIYLNHKRK